MWIRGWKGELDTARVWVAIKQGEIGTPTERMVVQRLLRDDYTAERMRKEFPTAAPSYLSWLRWRAKCLIKKVIREDPKFFGLEPIPPVDGKLTTEELAAHAGVGKEQILRMAQQADKLGLPKPRMRLGRTLRGRGFVFTSDVAMAYIEKLGE